MQVAADWVKLLTHPPNRRKRTSKLLHTVSRIQVVQYENRSETVHTVLRLNVSLASGDMINWVAGDTISWLESSWDGPV